jgi:phage baseplate assembly protein W
MAKEFLGRGWKFPVEPDSQGRLNYSADEAKIQESILVILGTARGERVMRPDFGSRLHELVFAPINTSTRGLIIHYVTEALVTWEPRIELLRVDVTEEDALRGILQVSIEYKVRATNSRFNLVYPFYLREGEGINAGTQAG